MSDRGPLPDGRGTYWDTRMHDPPRLLIVDDEPHITGVLRFKMSAAGFEVCEASNGADAFDLAVEQPPDLVITDRHMPGGDGLELAVALHNDERTRDVPVIMLSARGHTVAEGQTAATHIVRMLAKPFSPREVLATAREVLGMAA